MAVGISTPVVTSAAALVDQSIVAIRAGDRARAAQLLAQAIQIDPNEPQAWLWLSGIVGTDAERRFCLERVRAIDPHSAAARQGLAMLPADVAPQPPTAAPPTAGPTSACTFPGCAEPVARAGHTLCHAHWRAIYRPPPRSTPAAAAPAAGSATAAAPTSAVPSAPAAPSAAVPLLAAAALAERLGVPERSIIGLLGELGWIGTSGAGWRATPAGLALGAVQKFNTQSGVPYVLWPEAVLANEVLRRAISRSAGEDAAPAPGGDLGFRERFPARHRTTDGHWVRSKAEQLIDNWLYMAGIVHAYERQLPIEEEVYCDFYIPAGRVYIEYWGRERDPQYAARMERKRAIYQKYQLHLIELTDDHLRNLDDYLPKVLLRFGVTVST